MHEFGLFSAVFKIPDQIETSIGGQRGSQGVVLLEAAQQLLSDWEPEVLPVLLVTYPKPHSSGTTIVYAIALVWTIAPECKASESKVNRFQMSP